MHYPARDDVAAAADLAYAAALGDGSWEPFSEWISETFHDAMGALFIADHKTSTTELIAYYGMSDTTLSSFNAHYAQVNPYPATINPTNARYGPITDEDFLPRDEVRKSEFYNDWIKPQGKDVTQVGLIVAQSGNRSAILAIHPDPSAYDANLAHYRSLLTRLAPHMANAARISEKLAQRDRSERTLDGVLRCFDAAVVALDEAARPITINPLAEPLFAADGPLRLDLNGAVKARRPSDEATLSAALKRAAIGPIGAPRPVRLAADALGGGYMAWLAPARSAAARQTHARLADLYEPNVAALLIVTRASSELVVAPSILQESLGITAAEARLAAALARGKTLAKYAAENDLSRNTVRNQLTKIFEKVGVNKQKDLVAIVAAMAGGVSGLARGGADAASAGKRRPPAA